MSPNGRSFRHSTQRMLPAWEHTDLELVALASARVRYDAAVGGASEALPAAS